MRSLIAWLLLLGVLLALFIIFGGFKKPGLLAVFIIAAIAVAVTVAVLLGRRQG